VEAAAEASRTETVTRWRWVNIDLCSWLSATLAATRQLHLPLRVDGVLSKNINYSLTFALEMPESAENDGPPVESRN